MPHQDWEVQQPWEEVGSLDTVVTTPAATARSAAKIEVLDDIIIYRIPQGTASLRFRFRTTIAEDSDGVVDILTVRQHADLQDDYSRAGTVTVTAGTQTADTGFTYGDTVVVSNATGTNQEIKAVSPTGDYIGELLMNVEGVSKIAFVATALAGSKVLDIDVAKGTYKHIFLKS